MKPFPIDKQIELNRAYKPLDEMGFADLYIEVPEQDFRYIRAAAEQSIEWLQNKQPLHFSVASSYTLFALNHMLRRIHKTIKYS